MATIDIAEVEFEVTGALPEAAQISISEVEFGKYTNPSTPASLKISKITFEHPYVEPTNATISISEFKVFHPYAHLPISVFAGENQDSVEPSSIITLTGEVVDPDSILSTYGWVFVESSTPEVTSISLQGVGLVSTFEAPDILEDVILTFKFWAKDIWNREYSDIMKVGVMWSPMVMKTSSGLVPVSIKVMQ